MLIYRFTSLFSPPHSLEIKSKVDHSRFIAFVKVILFEEPLGIDCSDGLVVAHPVCMRNCILRATRLRLAHLVVFLLTAILCKHQNIWEMQGLRF